MFEIFDLLRQATFWLLILLNGVALIVAISWPRAKGKGWVIAFLSLLVFQQLYFRLFDAFVRHSDDHSRLELYQQFEAFNFLILLLGLAAHAFLVIGLFRLRKSLIEMKSGTMPGDFQHVMPTAAVRESWPVKGGSILGAFRVGGYKSVALAKSVTLKVHEDGSVSLNAKYDPAGSILYAFLASIFCGIVFTTLLRDLGFAAVPGWLVWYLLIVQLRRREIFLNLLNSDSIVVDAKTSRIGFRIPFESKTRWLAVEFLSEPDFQSAEKALSAISSKKVSDGQVSNASALPIVLLLALIFGVAGLVITYILSQTGF